MNEYRSSNAYTASFSAGNKEEKLDSYQIPEPVNYQGRFGECVKVFRTSYAPRLPWYHREPGRFILQITLLSGTLFGAALLVSSGIILAGKWLGWS